MEILFPTSLDNVKKEKPIEKGMKPFIISKKEILVRLLNKINSETQMNDYSNLGASHIILVRNKEDKEPIEKEFSKFKCPVMTIYESKVLFINT